MIRDQKQATEAVESAPWDEDGSALSGADIWGAHGEFASPRATSHFTYRQALAECGRAPDSPNA